MHFPAGIKEKSKFNYIEKKAKVMRVPVLFCPSQTTALAFLKTLKEKMKPLAALGQLNLPLM